jgi:uncharacterized protein (TIRG00374 family)
MVKTRKLFIVLANLVVLTLIFYWLRKNISLGAFLYHFKQIPTNGLLFLFALNTFVLPFYGFRLSILLASERLKAVMVVIIGFGMNGVMPFRLGEVAKLGYARKFFGISTPRLLAATALEKLMDLCALLVIGVVVAQLVSVPFLKQGVVTTGLAIVSILTVILFGFIVLVQRDRVGKKAYRWLAEAADTIKLYAEMKKMVHLSIITFAIWFITVAATYIMFSSIFSQFTIMDSFVLTLVLALAIAIPGAPGGIGVVEAAIVAYLQQALNAEPNQALASALFFRMVIVVPQILLSAVIILYLTHSAKLFEAKSIQMLKKNKS